MGNRTVNDSPFPFTAVNDAMLIRYTSPLNGVILVNGTKGVYDGTFVYEYWNGSTWNSLSDIYMISTSMTDWSDMTVTDGSTPFKGICDIIRWHSPDDWVSSSPGGSLVAGFWMRIRLATKNSITTTPILSYSQIATTSTATSFESTFLAPFNGSDKMRMKIYLTGGNIDAIPMPIFIRIMAY
jgi:hypothetical protein